MRPHTRPPRAGSALLRPSVTRPAARRRLDVGVGVGGCRVRERQSSDLTIHVREDRPRLCMSVVGELDLASVGLLTAMLDHIRRLHRRTGAVVASGVVDVDLTGVTFADSHGLAPLLDSRIRIVAASSAVRRVLFLLRDLPLTHLAPPADRQTLAEPDAA